MTEESNFVETIGQYIETLDKYRLKDDDVMNIMVHLLCLKSGYLKMDADESDYFDTMFEKISANYPLKYIKD